MPEQVIWNSSLETGIRAIDLQHEELIGMLNELGAAVRQQEAASILPDIQRRLGTYILFHFATEESLMQGLPGTLAHAEQHAEQHRAFVAGVAALKESAGQAGGAASDALLQFLRNWLLEHIMKTDRMLGSLLLEAGGKH